LLFDDGDLGARGIVEPIKRYDYEAARVHVLALEIKRVSDGSQAPSSLSCEMTLPIESTFRCNKKVSTAFPKCPTLFAAQLFDCNTPVRNSFIYE